MYNGLLHLHNFLRWIIIIFLLITIIQAFMKNAAVKKTSLWLVITAHLTLLLGLYQYFVGNFGYKLIQTNGFAAVMKDSAMRFWAVEHISGMIIAIILITVARSKSKKSAYSTTGLLCLLALIIILAVVPWPFREGIARPWFPGI